MLNKKGWIIVVILVVLVIGLSNAVVYLLAKRTSSPSISPSSTQPVTVWFDPNPVPPNDNSMWIWHVYVKAGPKDVIFSSVVRDRYNGDRHLDQKPFTVNLTDGRLPAGETWGFGEGFPVQAVTHGIYDFKGKTSDGKDFQISARVDYSQTPSPTTKSNVITEIYDFENEPTVLPYGFQTIMGAGILGATSEVRSKYEIDSTMAHSGAKSLKLSSDVNTTYWYGILKPIPANCDGITLSYSVKGNNIRKEQNPSNSCFIGFGFYDTLKIVESRINSYNGTFDWTQGELRLNSTDLKSARDKVYTVYFCIAFNLSGELWIDNLKFEYTPIPGQTLSPMTTQITSQTPSLTTKSNIITEIYDFENKDIALDDFEIEKGPGNLDMGKTWSKFEIDSTTAYTGTNALKISGNISTNLWYVIKKPIVINYDDIRCSFAIKGNNISPVGSACFVGYIITDSNGIKPLWTPIFQGTFDWTMCYWELDSNQLKSFRDSNAKVEFNIVLFKPGGLWIDNLKFEYTLLPGQTYTPTPKTPLPKPTEANTSGPATTTINIPKPGDIIETYDFENQSERLPTGFRVSMGARVPPVNSNDDVLCKYGIDSEVSHTGAKCFKISADANTNYWYFFVKPISKYYDNISVSYYIKGDNINAGRNPMPTCYIGFIITQGDGTRKSLTRNFGGTFDWYQFQDTITSAELKDLREKNIKIEARIEFYIAFYVSGDFWIDDLIFDYTPLPMPTASP
jgi:hypothetical protein